jgi:hypothetical protein
VARAARRVSGWKEDDMPATDGAHRLSDDESHAQACRHLVDALGLRACPPVCWDPDHILQGHVVVEGKELVLIAPRTSDHDPIVLSEDEWDGFRRATVRR